MEKLFIKFNIQKMSSKSPRSPRSRQPAIGGFDPTFALLIVFAVAVIAVVYFVWSSDDIKTVTQATNVSTAVTINGDKGIITTLTQSAAAAGEVVFTVNNSYVKADSLVLATIQYPEASTGYPTMHIADVAAGSFKVIIRNSHAADALNGIAKIHFRVY